LPRGGHGWGDDWARDGCAFGGFVDEDGTTGEAAGDDVLFEVEGDPVGRGAGEKTEVGAVDGGVAFVLCADVVVVLVIDGGEEVDHAETAGTEELGEFGDDAGHGGEGFLVGVLDWHVCYDAFLGEDVEDELFLGDALGGVWELERTDEVLGGSHGGGLTIA